jgi:hypothetical protein
MIGAEVVFVLGEMKIAFNGCSERNDVGTTEAKTILGTNEGFKVINLDGVYDDTEVETFLTVGKDDTSFDGDFEMGDFVGFLEGVGSTDGLNVGSWVGSSVIPKLGIIVGDTEGILEDGILVEGFEVATLVGSLAFGV